MKQKSVHTLNDITDPSNHNRMPSQLAHIEDSDNTRWWRLYAATEHYQVSYLSFYRTHLIQITLGVAPNSGNQLQWHLNERLREASDRAHKRNL
jgi:hypothetical protein